MAWVAVDYWGNECIYQEKPFKEGLIYTTYSRDYSSIIELPKGSIKKLIGRNLDWNDEPVELKEE